MKEKSQHLMLSSLFVLAFLTLGCEAQTEPITITTVEGKVPSGQIFQNLKILGIVQLETHTDNRSDAKDGLFVTRSRVQIPVGTQLIIPVVNGWSVGFGKVSDKGENVFTWSPEDHHYGLQQLAVFVDRISPPDQNSVPVKQSASIGVEFYLSDKNHDDKWFGTANYTLICLGVEGSGGKWLPVELDPPQVMINPNHPS